MKRLHLDLAEDQLQATLYIKNYYLLVSSDVLLVLEATSVARMEAVRGTIL